MIQNSKKRGFATRQDKVNRQLDKNINTKTNEIINKFNIKDIELENKIKEINDKIIYLENKSPWIIGQIISVKVGTPLQPGWKKLEITDGFALVAGTSAGNTTGTIKSHTHTQNKQPIDLQYGTTGAERHDHFHTSYVAPGWDGGGSVISSSNTSIYTNKTISTSATGGTNNLAAGYNVEFWEYTG